MGWSLGYDTSWRRHIGYAVPAYCDHPDCKAEIHRGLSYVCGGEPYGGSHGCGLFFCSRHLWMSGHRGGQQCERCRDKRENLFEPKPEHPYWVHRLLTHPSWQAWRVDHHDEVTRLSKLPSAPCPEETASCS